MTLIIEEVPSNRTKCSCCGADLIKGAIRLKKSEYSGAFLSHKYWCSECGMKYLEDKMNETSSMIKQLYERCIENE